MSIDLAVQHRPVTRRTRVALLAACFNRRDTTLRCLTYLNAQEGLEANLEVHLPNGTEEAVREAFSQVQIITALFWSNSIHRAIMAAVPTGANFMLRLNDDVPLHSGALAGLLTAHARATAQKGPACSPMRVLTVAKATTLPRSALSSLSPIASPTASAGSAIGY